MPRLLLALALGTALPLLAACADVGEAPAATTAAADSTADVALAGTPLPIDTTQSRVEWTAAKVTRTHEGGFRTFAGALYLDGDRVTGAEVTADAASIYSDSDRLTGHLRSDDFFDVARFPSIRFVVTALTPDTTGGATHRAAGTLTMRGHTNRVEFPATIRVAADAVTAAADFTIDRQDWGLTYPGQPDDLIQDEVRLRLRVVAPRGAAPNSAAGAP